MVTDTSAQTGELQNAVTLSGEIKDNFLDWPVPGVINNIVIFLKSILIHFTRLGIYFFGSLSTCCYESSNPIKSNGQHIKLTE